MKDLTVKNVNLFGDTIMAAKDLEGNIWAGVSYFCRGLGLNKSEKDRQIKNVQSDIILKRGCRKFDAGVFDLNNEVVALKLDFIPLWLAKINITPNMKENNPELVEKLVEYQLKAKDILAEAFLNQRSTVTYQYPVSPTALDSAAKAGRLAERIMKAEGCSPYEIALIVKSIFSQAGIELHEKFVKIPEYEQLTLTAAAGFREITK